MVRLACFNLAKMSSNTSDDNPAADRANVETTASSASAEEAKTPLFTAERSNRSTNRAGSSPSVFSVLAWWLPELMASCVSILALIAIIITLRVYNGKAVARLRLPSSLTLNDIVAALTTLSETLLIVPVGSSLMQETWLYYTNSGRRESSKGQLREIEMFHSAYRGVLGEWKASFSLPRTKVSDTSAPVTTVYSRTR